MNAATIIQIVSGLAALIPSIAGAWNSATGSSLQKVASVVTSSAGASLESWLAEIGGQLFPSLSSNLHAAAAALIAAESHTGAIAWVQSALNMAQAAGLVTFNGAGTNPGTNSALTVDGVFGPRTQAAILALQSKFGLPTTGMFADDEISILQAAASGGTSTQSLQGFLQGLLSKI